MRLIPKFGWEVIDWLRIGPTADRRVGVGRQILSEAMSEVGDMVRGINGEYMIRPPEKYAPTGCRGTATPASTSPFGPALGVNCEVPHGPARALSRQAA
jgi:hypothetical protein